MTAQRTVETNTFMFTDIEGSTRLLQELGDRYPQVLDDQRRLISTAVENHGGRVFGSEGDALFAAFPSAVGAVAAAAESQRSLAGHAWPSVTPLRVRMGIHTGEAMAAGDNFVGLALHEVARIMAAGHGGQVLVSEATRRVAQSLPHGLELRDLGERRLKDLAAPERLYQLVSEGLADKFPPLRTLDARNNNLPVQVTSFIGRAELAAARAALAETRLLTLTGPGGTGKTRLALQLAGDVSDQFTDGVFFVPLDAITDPMLLASQIASSIGLTLSGTGSPADAVIGYLRDRQALLLLDNFEQIIEAATEVGRLVREAPGIKIIVTTRIVLRVYGERDFPVPPLGLPPPGGVALPAEEAAEYEAVRLFVERARAVQPAFGLTDDNAQHVVEICRRLDGLPLAIELAAARTRLLSVAAIHARLDSHLALLTGGSRDLPGRQQTLRGAIDWSYELLEQADRKLFERFSVHAGGAFLSQADEVCGPAQELGEDVLDGLSSLGEKSLVKPDLGVDEDPRFTMLTTIRDYAHERLEKEQDFDQLARRHAHAYLGLVEGCSDRLLGRESRRLSDRLEQDHDNLRAALDWAVAHQEVDFALRFMASVWRFWQTRGHLDEARRRAEIVIGLPGVPDQPKDLLARAYAAVGGIAYWQADVRATHRYYTLGLEAARASGDERLVGQALYNLSFAPLAQDTLTSALYVAGRPHLEDAIAIYEQLGDKGGLADAKWALSQATGAMGDTEGAMAYAVSALADYRDLNDPFRTGWGLYMVAGLRAVGGDVPGSLSLLRESLSIFADARDRSGILLILAGYAVASSLLGDQEFAARTGGVVETLRASTGAGLIDATPEFIQFQLPKRPDDPHLVEVWEAGARISLEEAVAETLEWSAAAEEAADNAQVIAE